MYVTRNDKKETYLQNQNVKKNGFMFCAAIFINHTSCTGKNTEAHIISLTLSIYMNDGEAVCISFTTARLFNHR